MAKRIDSLGVKVSLLTLIIVFFGLGQVLTQDFSTLIKEAETRDAKFEKEVKDMTVVQEIKTFTTEGEMTSEVETLRKGDKFRMETKPVMTEGIVTQKSSEMETAVVSNGQDTWMISPIVGKKEISEEEVTTYETGQDWRDLVSEKGKIVGIEKVAEKECYVVEIQGKESPFKKLWLDKTSLNLIKSESKGPKGETILMLNSDFRKIKGDLEMPYKTEVFVDSNLISSSAVKSMEINKGLSDDLFDPAKIKVEKKKGPGMPGMMRRMLQEKVKEKEEEEIEEK